MHVTFLSSHNHIAAWRQRVSYIVRAARTEPQFIAAVQSQPRVDHRSLVVQGWQSLQQGDIEAARTMFRAALHHDPYAISAWVGLSRATEQPDARRSYLQAAIDLHHLLISLEHAPRPTANR